MLRQYQQKGIEDIYTSWAKGYRSVMYQLDTGGGKTPLTVQLIKDELKKQGRIIFIAHREELINQAWETLYRNKIFAGIIKGGIDENYNLPVQVCSIQTLIRKNKLPKATVILVDEAHHALEDNSYGTVIDKFWPTALIAGVTATPYRLSGEGFGGMFHKLVLAKNPDGSLCNMISLRKQGFLVDLKYYSIEGYDNTLLTKQGGDYTSKSSYEALKLAPLVETYYKHCEGMHGIIFASNVEHGMELEKQYNKEGVRAVHIDANTNKYDRQNAVKLLKKQEASLINVGIATEGFDSPGARFVQLGKKTLSLSLYLQMIGRAGRVDNEIIKHCKTDLERLEAIKNSDKPFGIILDNSGCGFDNMDGLNLVTGTCEIDWNVYFNGWKDKRKEDKDLEKIELIEFVAEDEEGRRFVTKQPEEIAGMRLIEVNSSIKERVINITSLKKFDELFAMFHRMPKVKKVGFVAYFGYRDYCEKNRILMNDSVWEYLFKRLVKDRREKVKDHQKYFETVKSNILQAPEKYPDSEELIKGAEKNMKKQIEKCNMYGVPESFLKKEMKEYKIKLEKEMNTYA